MQICARLRQKRVKRDTEIGSRRSTRGIIVQNNVQTKALISFSNIMCRLHASKSINAQALALREDKCKIVFC